LQITKD